MVLLELPEERSLTQRALTQAELADRAMELAGWLCDHHCRGQRVAYVMRNSIEVFEILSACRRIGASAVAINHHSTAAETRYVLRDSGAKVVIGGAQFADMLREACVGLPIEQLFVGQGYERARGASHESSAVPKAVGGGDGVIIYTSGTTGKPKGVVRKLAAGGAGGKRYVMLFAKLFSLSRKTVHLVTGPLYHTAPNTFARFALALGGRIVIMQRFDAEATLAAVEQHRITNMHLVPTMMHRLLRLDASIRERYDLSSLVSVQHAAAPCPIETKREMIEWWGPVIQEYYGSTEAGVVTFIGSKDALAKPGSVGRAVEGVQLRITNDDGADAAPGEIGDVCVRNMITDGFRYHGDDAKQAAAMRDGFFTTGDVGYLDDDGFLFLCDRRANMIIAGGVNIYPAEVEAALMSHPDVEDAAVYGVDDEEWGQRVVAAVRLAAGGSSDDAALRSHLEERIARFKIPRSFAFVDALPREMSGKMFKRRLRDDEGLVPNFASLRFR